MASHALLLRLFLSPSFFSVHVALKYLLEYSENIGITYYLTARLSDLDTADLHDVWGFVWYYALHRRPTPFTILRPAIFSLLDRPGHELSNLSS